MRALILWAEPESVNLGVGVLARGTQRLLERAFPGVETQMQSFGPGDAPVRIGNARGQLKRLLSPHDELVDWVRGFDVVVDTRAGDSFTDIYGRSRLTTMSLMAEIVRRAKVPLVLGPQTIGPFESRRGRILARRALAGSRVVFARDSISGGVAEELGYPAIATTDVVFALDPVEPTGPERDVIVNPSGLLWTENSHVDSAAYQDTILRLVRELLERGRRVSLLAHVLASPLVDNDVNVVAEVAERLDADVEVLVPTDLDDVRRMLASAQVVVGSRMHACLNAMSLGRPAIPLAYSRKFAPLLADLGWARTVDLNARVDHVAEVLSAIDAPTLDADAAAVSDRAHGLVQHAREALDRAF